MPIDAPVDSDFPSRRRAWSVTVLLTFAFVFSFIDRQILNLLVGPIQTDLGLSDTEISLLQGFAFVSTYVVLSIPLGRLVDTSNRIPILSAGIAFWSFATIACGVARGFSGLFVARAAVGLGEATLTPAGWSLLSDYFPPKRRLVPFSIFLTGPYIGAGIAMILGGVLMESLLSRPDLQLPLVGSISAWQATFIAVGTPGLFLAAIVFCIREPQRKEVLGDAPNAVPAAEIIAWVKQHKRIYSALMLGVPFIALVLYGLQAWIPTYLIRVQEMSLLEAGTQYGSIALIAGSAGVLSGAFFGALLQRRGYADFQLRVALWVLLLVFPFLIGLAFAPSRTLALVCIAAVSFLAPVPLALTATCIQAVTPNRMRGVMAGLHIVTVNVVGLALGPTSVAFATDVVFADGNAVGLSLSLVGCVACVAGVALIAPALRPLADLLNSQSVTAAT